MSKNRNQQKGQNIEATQAPKAAEQVQDEQLQKAEDKALEQASEAPEATEAETPKERGETNTIMHVDESAFKDEKPASLSEMIGNMPAPTAFEKAVVDAEASELVELRSAVNMLTEYVREMAPNRIIPMAMIAKQQTAMWRAINGILVSERGFNQGIRLLTAFFREYREGALKANLIMRGLEDTEYNRMTVDARRSLANMLALLNCAAGLENVKQAHKVISLKSCFEPIALTDAQRTRLVSFFS